MAYNQSTQRLPLIELKPERQMSRLSRKYWKSRKSANSNNPTTSSADIAGEHQIKGNILQEQTGNEVVGYSTAGTKRSNEKQFPTSPTKKQRTNSGDENQPATTGKSASQGSTSVKTITSTKASSSGSIAINKWQQTLVKNQDLLPVQQIQQNERNQKNQQGNHRTEELRQPKTLQHTGYNNAFLQRQGQVQSVKSAARQQLQYLPQDKHDKIPTHTTQVHPPDFHKHARYSKLTTSVNVVTLSDNKSCSVGNETEDIRKTAPTSSTRIVASSTDNTPSRSLVVKEEDQQVVKDHDKTIRMNMGSVSITPPRTTPSLSSVPGILSNGCSSQNLKHLKTNQDKCSDEDMVTQQEDKRLPQIPAVSKVLQADTPNKDSAVDASVQKVNILII